MLPRAVDVEAVPCKRRIPSLPCADEAAIGKLLGHAMPHDEAQPKAGFGGPHR
jgi:hypothetical protein